MATITEHNWREWAKCFGLDDPDAIFFPVSEADEAVNCQFCNDCPVRDWCLTYALEHPRESKWGIWGGLTADQRINLRRSRTRAASTTKQSAPVAV